MPLDVNSFNSMRENGVLTDVTLVASGCKVKAHKNILAARSPYFYKVLTSGNLIQM